MPFVVSDIEITEEHISDVIASGIESVYQPIVNLRRLEVVGYEALTRFHHPEISATPDQWFDAANRQGRLDALEAKALASAFAARADLPPRAFLTVNVEPMSMRSPRVRRVIQRQGQLNGVVFEITEHSAYDIDSIAPTLAQVRNAGATIAMDDAGAGHSGLQQILTLRPSVLKLDRSLIEGVDDDEVKSALVEMMGVFATRIDAMLLAEGVETANEARRLRTLGVPLVQGYYFGRPAAPWSDLDVGVRAELWQDDAEGAAGLYPLLSPVASLPARHPNLAAMARATGRRFVAVVDANDRPLGVVDSTSPDAGCLLPAMTSHVIDRPEDVAARLSTSDKDPALPIVVVDNAGTYLGLLSLRRLLGHLSKALASH